MSMGDMGLPPLTWERIFHVDVVSWATVGCLLAICGYLAVAQRARRLHGDAAWPAARVWCFLGFSLTTWFAIASGVGAYDMTLFYVHMVQHVILVMIAAPLLAASAPVELIRQASAGRAHEIIATTLDSRVAGFVGHPAVGFLSYAALIPLFHLTALFDRAMASVPLHRLELVLFVGVGYLFWRPVVAVEPSRHRLHPGLRLVYVLFAVPVDTITGLALVSATTAPFHAFSFTRHWGPSVLTDIHTGGAVMWIFGDLLMMVMLIPVAIAWLAYEGREERRIDAILDAPTAAEATTGSRGQRRSAWLPPRVEGR